MLHEHRKPSSDFQHVDLDARFHLDEVALVVLGNEGLCIVRKWKGFESLVTNHDLAFADRRHELAAPGDHERPDQSDDDDDA